MDHNVILIIFLIFAGASVMATMAIYLRQSLIVAYMLLGLACGVYGIQHTTNFHLIHKFDDIGVVFFMFLLGLQLQPTNLLRTISKTSLITLISSLSFGIMGFSIAYFYGFPGLASAVIGACMMFSSSIVSLNLFPFDLPHKQYIGELMVSILLLQDLLAIIVLLVLNATNTGIVNWQIILKTIIALPGIFILAFGVERLGLSRILNQLPQHTKEYLLLVAIAWCLGIALLAEQIGLTYEIGAFVAGIALAGSKNVHAIEKQLKPLRDFFLIFFFFIIGASFDTSHLTTIAAPSIILTLVFVFLKPLLFYQLLRNTKEPKPIAKEIGVRLNQLSEFSLLLVLVAYQYRLIEQSVVYLIQIVTMLMFIISSYAAGRHNGPPTSSAEPRKLPYWIW